MINYIINLIILTKQSILQCFLIYVAGSIIFGTMVLVVVSARWEVAKTLKGTKEEVAMLNGFMALVIFFALWFQCFVYACSKFLIGYLVGVWYFTTYVHQLESHL